MATLADVNQTLGQVAANTAKTGSAVDKLTSYFKGGSGDRLEKEREKKTTNSLFNLFNRGGGSKVSGSSGSKSGFPLDFGGIVGAFSLASLGKGLLKTLPGVILFTLADEIVNKVIDPKGQLTKEAKDLFIGSIEGASLAAILGKRFIPLGIALGALNRGLDDETKKAGYDKFTKAIERINSALFGETSMGPGGVMRTTSGLLGEGGFFSTFATGLNSIAGALEGDWDEASKGFKEALAVIGGTLVLMSPLSPFRLFMSAIAGTGKKGFFGRGLARIGTALLGGAAVSTLFKDSLFDGFTESPVDDGENADGTSIPPEVVQLATLLGGIAVFEAGRYVIVKAGQVIWSGTKAAAAAALAKAGITKKPMDFRNTANNKKPKVSVDDLARAAQNSSAIRKANPTQKIQLEKLAKQMGLKLTPDGGVVGADGKYVSREVAEEFQKRAMKQLGMKAAVMSGAKVAAKVALRFVPGLGLVMLAADAYGLARDVSGYIGSDQHAFDMMSDIDRRIEESATDTSNIGGNLLRAELRQFKKDFPEIYEQRYGKTGIGDLYLNNPSYRPQRGPAGSVYTPVDPDELSQNNTGGGNINIGQVGSNNAVTTVNPIAMMEFGTGDKFGINSRIPNLHSTSGLA